MCLEIEKGCDIQSKTFQIFIVCVIASICVYRKNWVLCMLNVAANYCKHTINTHTHMYMYTYNTYILKCFYILLAALFRAGCNFFATLSASYQHAVCGSVARHFAGRLYHRYLLLLLPPCQLVDVGNRK